MFAIRMRLILTGLLLVLMPIACVHAATDEAMEAGFGSQLDELLAYARQHHPGIAAAQLDTEVANARASVAGALPDPRLRIEWMDINDGGERNPSPLPGRVGSTKYSLMQDLPWPGKRALARAVAGAEADAAERNVDVRWNELAAAITTSFAELYYVDQDIHLLVDILGLLETLERSARVRYAAGLAPQQDVIRAQLEQSALRGRQIDLDAARTQWQARLNALAGRPIAAPLAPPAALRPLPRMEQLDLASLESRIHRSNPQLLAEAAQIRAAQGERDRVRRDRYPDFSLGIAPTQVHNSVREWELMLELSIPLQQRARRGREHASEAQLAAAQARESDLARQIVGSLGEQLAALRAALQTRELIDTRLVPQAMLTLQSALAGYESGQVDFSTLLEAQKQLFEARLNRSQASLEAYTRLAQIEMLVGENL